MFVQAFVVVRRDIAAWELAFNPLQGSGVNRHQIFIVAVLGAILDHPDLAVALDDLGLNFADLFMHQVAPVLIAIDNGFARFLNAGWAERVCLAREAERWLGLFPGFQQRLVGPLRRDRRIRIALIEILNGIKSDSCRLTDYPVDRPEELRRDRIRHTAAASLSKSE